MASSMQDVLVDGDNYGKVSWIELLQMFQDANPNVIGMKLKSADGIVCPKSETKLAGGQYTVVLTENPGIVPPTPP